MPRALASLRPIFALTGILIGSAFPAGAAFLDLDVTPTGAPLEFRVNASLVMTEDASLASFDGTVRARGGSFRSITNEGTVFAPSFFGATNTISPGGEFASFGGSNLTGISASAGDILPLGSAVILFDDEAGGGLDLAPETPYSALTLDARDITTAPSDPILFQFGELPPLPTPPVREPSPPLPRPRPVTPFTGELEVNMTPTGNPGEYRVEPVYLLSGDAGGRLGVGVYLQAENGLFSQPSNEGAQLRITTTQLGRSYDAIRFDRDGNRLSSDPGRVRFSAVNPSNPLKQTDLTGVRELSLGSAIVTFRDGDGALANDGRFPAGRGEGLTELPFDVTSLPVAGNGPPSEVLVPNLPLDNPAVAIPAPEFDSSRFEEFIIPEDDGLVLGLYWAFSPEYESIDRLEGDSGMVANFILDNGELLGFDDQGSVLNDVAVEMFGASIRVRGEFDEDRIAAGESMLLARLIFDSVPTLSHALSDVLVLGPAFGPEDLGLPADRSGVTEARLVPEPEGVALLLSALLLLGVRRRC